jgi:hypothetical protein
MSMLWIAAMLVAAAPAENAANATAATTQPKMAQTAVAEKDVVAEKADAAEKKEPIAKPLTGKELKKATEAALRRWARCKDEQMAAAAGEFLVLYHDLQNDTAIHRATRDQLRHKVRFRLLKLAPRISQKAAIDRRRAELAAKKASQGSPSKSMADKPTEEPSANGARGGGALRNDDYGQQLVDLIHTTILPHTWDVNGGMGSMYYWRNGRAVVARQTQEGHEQMENLLEQLRRANN